MFFLRRSVMPTARIRQYTNMAYVSFSLLLVDQSPGARGMSLLKTSSSRVFSSLTMLMDAAQQSKRRQFYELHSSIKDPSV